MFFFWFCLIHTHSFFFSCLYSVHVMCMARAECILFYLYLLLFFLPFYYINIVWRGRERVWCRFVELASFLFSLAFDFGEKKKFFPLFGEQVWQCFHFWHMNDNKERTRTYTHTHTRNANLFRLYHVFQACLLCLLFFFTICFTPIALILSMELTDNENIFETFLHLFFFDRRSKKEITSRRHLQKRNETNK